MRSTGQAPYGYQWKGDQLVRCLPEASIRRKMFEWVLEDRSKAAVARRLNEAGHATRRGGKWSDVAVGRQLACTSAIGLYVRNRTMTDADGKRVERPKDEWETVACPAIIDEDLWNEVQRTLDSKGGRKVGRDPSHPLAGLLFCHCGKKMYGASGTPKFACSTCGNRFPIADLEAMIQDEIEAFLADRTDLLSELIAEDPAVSEARQESEKLDAEFASTEQELDRVRQLFVSGQIDTDKLGSLQPSLESKLASLRKQHDTAKRRFQQAQKSQESDDSKSKIEVDPIERFRERWPELPTNQRAAILQALFEKIVIADHEIEIHYTFDPSSEDLRTTKPQQIEDPTNRPLITTDEPVYIRLPKGKNTCPRTGLTRGVLNDLILPNKRNGFNPPVKSVSHRREGNVRGTRLIVWESLKTYLERQRNG
ncbi:MAG: site-specific DNA recombinase [Verrucomicrobiales bacterium]|jgi:site-specific DNA recombinase